MLAPAVIPALALASALWTPADAEPFGPLGPGVRLVSLPPLAAPGEPQRIAVPFDDGHLVADLHPHSVRAPGFRFHEAGPGGVLTPVDPGPITTLRGVIAGMDGSAVAGGLVPGGVALAFVLPDGRTLWLEPAAPHLPGADPGLHLLYTPADIPPGPHTCGNTDDHPARPAQPDTGDLRGVPMHEAELACDADYEYFTHWGGSTAARQRIEAITATVNLQFERDTRITHRLGIMIVRTTPDDPYASSDPIALNSQISAVWSGIAEPYDLVILYTGRDINGTVVGRANAIGSVCNAHHSNCFAQSDYNGMYASACDLTAHELGHLWGACHCVCVSPAYTMNASITSVNRFGGPPSFCGPGSIPEITAYRSTRPCLVLQAGEPGPPNDACDAAVTLERGLWGYSTEGATASAEGGGGPIPPGCAQFGADIWYRYSPPCSGIVTISTCTSTFDTLLAVYDGTCADLNLIACNDNSDLCGMGSEGSRVTFDAQFGREYLIRLGSPVGAALTEGPGLLSITNAGCIAPANNSCSGAASVHPGVPLAFSTIGATAAPPLEPALCDSQDFQGFGPDIWFRYTAACSGPVRIATCGSDFDTRVAIYTACPSFPETAIACSDEDGPACAGSAASLDFDADEGTTYLIRVGGTNNQQGTGTLLVTPLTCPPPPNDACADATPTGLGATPFDTLGATTDGPTVTCAAFSGPVQRDVWFTLTSPCSAPLRIAVCDAAFDARLAIYTACPDDGGLFAACGDNTCGQSGLGPQVIHAAPEGTPLLIRVGAAGFAGGPATLTISIAADWDRDGQTNSSDIAAFLAAWLEGIHDGTRRDADFSGDAVINSADVSAFLSAWIAAVAEGC